ncbi:hypothetical protein [Sphingobacterium corticibacterium]|uniref:Uncharacterized protein n=1 Tax=Sphingobacterium corticibacterium TaxID=2484746 RepID=A0A4Q6XSP5_9SPHI|nr:hypothetical protein [Sphingobacterium corticibacterium]RZF59577.1 hypothetical protein EWE74_10470 [Sphingobacterium corticibacterium]
MVTVRIKSKNKQAKALIEMLRTFSFVEVEEEQRYNAETEKAIQEVRKGKVVKAENSEDLFKQLGI